MRRRKPLRAATITALVALACVTSACAAESSESGSAGSSDQTTPQSAPEESMADSVTNDDEDRVFDSSDDAVIQAAEAALKSQNAKAEWEGKTLRVTLDGSLDDATAHIPCLGMEVLVADEEDVTLVFSDGELICADRSAAN